MSSEDVERQPVEEHVEYTPADEAAPHDEEQVEAPEEEQEHAHEQEEEEEAPVEANGEAAEEPAANGAADEADEEVDEEAEAEEECLSDPRVFKMASREVDECYMSVIRGLSAFSTEDEEVFANAVDICNDIISMEQNLFSEPPSYVSNYLASYRATTDAYNSSVQARQTIPTAEGTPRDWEERRAYVDPGVPLMLPYDAERFKKEHPDRAQSEGTYHDLFYGDGSKMIFEPPADNKRKQIAEEQKSAYHPSKQSPPSYDPPRKKPMRVSADFVPACAEVVDPHRVERKRPSVKPQPKKASRKSASKK